MPSRMVDLLAPLDAVIAMIWASSAKSTTVSVCRRVGQLGLDQHDVSWAVLGMSTTVPAHVAPALTAAMPPICLTPRW